MKVQKRESLKPKRSRGPTERCNAVPCEQRDSLWTRLAHYELHTPSSRTRIFMRGFSFSCSLFHCASHCNSLKELSNSLANKNREREKERLERVVERAEPLE